MTTKRRADKCVTHHYACDCREYYREQLESALKVIHTWASVYSESPGVYDMRKEMKDIAKAAHDALHCLDGGNHD